MLKYIVSIFLTIFVLHVNGQNGFPYQDIILEKPSDYTDTEPMALSAAKFILTNPFEVYNEDRAKALLFLSNWVKGTKDYSFYFDGKVTDLSGDANLLSLFIAAMVKYTLENKAEAANPIRIETNASRIVLEYCQDEKNNFKLKKKYRRVLEGN